MVFTRFCKTFHDIPGVGKGGFGVVNPNCFRIDILNQKFDQTEIKAIRFLRIFEAQLSGSVSLNRD